jgi:hypothetical protein
MANSKRSQEQQQYREAKKRGSVPGKRAAEKSGKRARLHDTGEMTVAEEKVCTPLGLAAARRGPREGSRAHLPTRTRSLAG